jgi:hypothetical protein
MERFEGAEGEVRSLAHLKVLYNKEQLRQLVAQIKEWRETGLEGDGFGGGGAAPVGDQSP